MHTFGRSTQLSWTRINMGKTKEYLGILEYLNWTFIFLTYFPHNILSVFGVHLMTWNNGVYAFATENKSHLR